jgi:uncharacterized Zn-binding protein involved in type VI secretion
MPAAQRLNDPNDSKPPGNIIKVEQQTVFVNGQPLSVNGSEVSGHPGGKPHSDKPKTANGSSTVFVNNKPVNRVGDADTCGHKRLTGSSDVFVG